MCFILTLLALSLFLFYIAPTQVDLSCQGWSIFLVNHIRNTCQLSPINHPGCASCPGSSRT